MSGSANWTDASGFFAMGGYGLYVWGAYGMTALVIALDAWSALRRHRDARDDLDDVEGRR